MLVDVWRVLKSLQFEYALYYNTYITIGSGRVILWKVAARTEIDDKTEEVSKFSRNKSKNKIKVLIINH